MPLPLPGLGIAALLLGLTGPPPPAAPANRAEPVPDDLPRTARVVAPGVETYAEPDPSAFALDRLDPGEQIRVVDADRARGWLTVEPPASAFAWVEQSAVRPEGSGRARVSAPRTTLRAGVAGARLPGPARRVLTRGTPLTLLDRPPLVTAGGVWVAVAPPEGDVRYLRAQGLTWPGAARPVATPDPPAKPAPPPEIRASYRPGDGETWPAEIAGEVSGIEADHRASLSAPIDQWRLGPIRTRYEALLKRTTDPRAQAALRARIDLVSGQDEAARSARTIEAILARSRRRDHEVALAHRLLTAVDSPQRRPFQAEGLVQPSSRQVEGRRVYALIGPEGAPIAYLDIPPGLDARPVMTKRVGVRGSETYNDALNARLIAVRDLEPLE